MIECVMVIIVRCSAEQPKERLSDQDLLLALVWLPLCWDRHFTALPGSVWAFCEHLARILLAWPRWAPRPGRGLLTMNL